MKKPEWIVRGDNELWFVHMHSLEPNIVTQIIIVLRAVGHGKIEETNVWQCHLFHGIDETFQINGDAEKVKKDAINLMKDVVDKRIKELYHFKEKMFN